MQVWTLAKIVGDRNFIVDLMDVLPAAIAGDQFFSGNSWTFGCGNHQIILKFIVVEFEGTNMEDPSLVENIVLNENVPTVLDVQAEWFAVVERALCDYVVVFSHHVEHLHCCPFCIVLSTFLQLHSF